MSLVPLDRKARERQALARAFAWGLQADVRPGQQRNTYLVPSRSEPGLLHLVVANRSGRVFCSCPAGSVGAPCTHAAAVWLYLMEQRTGGTVTSVRP